MKKLTACLTGILVLAMCLGIPAFAAEYEDAYALISDWKKNGYPDDVGAAFSTDGSMERFTILLTGDTAEREEEIRAMLSSDDGLTFGSAEYSINTLRGVRDEILSTYSEDAIQDCTVGWGTDGGFGESGNEYRVVVDAYGDSADAYASTFSEFYGDMVVVESNGKVISTTTAGDTAGGLGGQFSVFGSSSPTLIFLGVAVAAYLLLRKRGGKNGGDGPDMDDDDDDDDDRY